jgi:hypothetical protein
MKIKQCPYCKNNIRIHQVKFPAINDYGGVIIQCQKCSELSYLKTINPDELSISLGGLKHDTWDDFYITEENIIEKYPEIKELIPGLEVIGDIEEREYSFNYEHGHIYYCNSCNNEVENIARKQFKIDFSIISEKFKSLINFVAANDGWNRENLIIEVNCKCNCGQEFISFWHYKYLINGLNLDSDKIYLIGTNMPLNTKNINGIMSKNNCIITLEKLIIRWNIIFPKLLIVTPFVGHQWMSKEEIIELWDWLKNYVHPEKTTLVTRTATFNKYKRACEEKGISIDLLDNFGINNPVIQDLTKKQDFHAKIYVGYSDTKSEILMGSFNLMNGPSMENISFLPSSYVNFIDSFISPLKISIAEPENIESNWSHIFKNDKNEWIAFDIGSNIILNKIMNYS